MPSAPKPHWIKFSLRYCGSCCITVTCWALWILLGVLFIGLSYIALARELPVPDILLRRAEATLAQSGLALQFGRARFDPTGKVLLEDVQLRSRPFDEPLFTCRLLYVRHNFWSLLSGWTLPEEIYIEGAALHLPAMVSPTGATLPIINDLIIVLHHADRTWQVKQFTGRIGRLALSVQGEIPGALPSATATPPTLEMITTRFVQTARHLAPYLSKLEAFDTPNLAVQLTSTTADLLFSAGAARHPWAQPVEIGSVIAGAQLPLGHGGARPVLVHLAARRLSHGEQMSAENIRAILSVSIDRDKFSARPLALEAAAGSVDFKGERALGPVLRADLTAWPDIQSSTAFQFDGETLAAKVETHLKEQSARIHAEGRVTASLINRMLSEHTPRAARYFVMRDPVNFLAEAVIAPGWRFERVKSRVDAGALDSHGVEINAARGRIDIVGTSFLAYDARVRMGENEARGSYWMDFATTDYRMLLNGRLRPADINGWFRGDWWLTFWNRYFAFPATPPTGNVDLQGRWKDQDQSSNFVRASAQSATIWGGDFENMDATLFMRPNFTHVLSLRGTRAEGTQELTGSAKRFGVPKSRDHARLEFDFTTNADTTVLGRMLEGRADDVLASLRFTQPPQVHAWGAIVGNRPAYRFTGTARSFHYYGFPLDSARVAGGVAGSDVHLGEIEYSAAGGQGSGRASLTGEALARRLGFDLFFNKAKLGRTIRAVQEYDAYRLGQPYVAATESKFVQQTGNSSLDVALSAQGDPNHIPSFRGTGNAALTGSALGEVHLFGLLSQLLSGLSLNFSSLKLDAIRSSFDLRDGALHFPDLKVTGPSAVIDGRGHYTIADNTLDFTAKFKPYDQPGSLLAAAVSLVVTPLTSILELKLGGRLDDPKWTVSLGPSAPPAQPVPGKPADPVPPAPATR